jgi:hypothetical protein
MKGTFYLALWRGMYMVVIEVNCGGTSLCTLFNVKNYDLRYVSLA